MQQLAELLWGGRGLRFVSLSALRPRTATGQNVGALFVRAIGLVLLCASIFKSPALFQEDIPIVFQWLPKVTHRWVVLGEGALGIWLLSGIWLRTAQRISFFVFLVFALTNAGLMVMGERSCGCFGRLRLRTEVVLFFDILAVVILGLALRRDLLQKRTVVCWRRVGFHFSLVAMSVLATLTLSFWSVIPGTKKASIPTSLEGLVGHPLPLLENTSIGNELRQGKWIVMFWRRGCPRCEFELEMLTRRTEEAALRSPLMGNTSRRLALIEVVGAGSVAPTASQNKSPYIVGYFSSEPKTVVPTPLILEIDEGIVTRRLSNLEFP